MRYNTRVIGYSVPCLHGWGVCLHSLLANQVQYCYWMPVERFLSDIELTTGSFEVNGRQFSTTFFQVGIFYL